MDMNVHYFMIKRILEARLGKTSYQFKIFGSRASGKARAYSDIDVAIIGDKPVSLTDLAYINDLIEQSSIPVNVDVVDFSRVSEDFKNIAGQSMIEL